MGIKGLSRVIKSRQRCLEPTILQASGAIRTAVMQARNDDDVDVSLTLNKR